MTVIITLLLCTALSMQCAAPEVVAQHGSHEDKAYMGLNEFLLREGKPVKQELHVPDSENYDVRAHDNFHDNRFLLLSLKTKRDEHGKKIDANPKRPMILHDTYTGQEAARWRMRKHSFCGIKSQDDLITFELTPHGFTTFEMYAYRTGAKNKATKLGPGRIHLNHPKTIFGSNASRFLTFGAPSFSIPEPTYHDHNVTIWDAQTLKKITTLKFAKEYFRTGCLTTRAYALTADGTRILGRAHKRKNKYDKQDSLLVLEQFNVDTKQKELALNVPQGIGYGWDTQTGQDLYVVSEDKPGETALHHYQNGELIHKQALFKIDELPEGADNQKQSSIAHIIPASEKKALVCLPLKHVKSYLVFLYDGNNKNIKEKLLQIPTLSFYSYAVDPTHRYFIFPTDDQDAAVIDVHDNMIKPLSFKYPIHSIEAIAGTHYARVACTKEQANQKTRYIDQTKRKVRKKAPHVKKASGKTALTYKGFIFEVSPIMSLTLYGTCINDDDNDKTLSCIHLFEDEDNNEIRCRIPGLLDPKEAHYYDDQHRYIAITYNPSKSRYYYIDMQTGQRIKEEDVPTLGVTGNVLEYTESNCYRIQPHVNPKHMSKEQIDLMYRAMQHKKATKQALDVAGNQQDAALFDTLPVFLKACDNIIRNNAS